MRVRIVSLAEPPTATAAAPEASTRRLWRRPANVSAACSAAPIITKLPNDTQRPDDGRAVTTAVTTPIAAAMTVDIPATTARHTSSTP